VFIKERNVDTFGARVDVIDISPKRVEIAGLTGLEHSELAERFGA
jgi:hypothetical protein